MKRGLILLLVVGGILYSSAEKLNKKKNPKSMDASFSQGDDYKYPGDIIESVHSNTPEAPQIKIRLANADEDDNGDATISLDLESEEDDDGNDLRIRKKKLPKSKTEDIHSFL